MAALWRRKLAGSCSKSRQAGGDILVYRRYPPIPCLLATFLPTPALKGRTGRGAAPEAHGELSAGRLKPSAADDLGPGQAGRAGDDDHWPALNA